MKYLNIDAAKCSGCRMCELACSFVKEKKIIPNLARVNVIADFSKGLSTPVVCMQCEDAPCVNVCPTKSLSRNFTSGAVVVSAEKCIGCKLCTTVCPYGAVVFESSKKCVIKCDLCEGEPTCVKFCCTSALTYEELSKSKMAKKREVAKKVMEILGESH
ncbi:MAG: 4Fe-4S ferredoxin [Elusimicrobia bacterium HGW-Elusimicrobia-4]|nr:MAG: 4Fe-4S ferredoxin [Elusimicrobia bacterium HGW-Elusimicrobia-4]